MTNPQKPIDITPYLAEDIGTGDITAAIIPESTYAEAEVITREDMVLCGQAWFDAVFKQLNPDIRVDWQVKEGDSVAKNTLLCKLQGSARALLTGERTALNLLQTLSATATVARQYAEAVKGTNCKVENTLPRAIVATGFAFQ